jgi:hypothetical protein
MISPNPNHEAAMTTTYVVQGFQRKGNKLVGDQPKPAKTAQAAVDLAGRLLGGRAGVIAFSQEVDIETDTYDEPRVLFRSGDLPPGLLES